MSKPQIEELVTSLGMPLRDVARTLRAASHASEAQLKAPAKMLPGPLRHLIKDTVRQADRLGSRLLDQALPGGDQILRAHKALHHGSQRLEDVSNLTRVISFGLSETLQKLGKKDWVVGDSRLALLVASTCSSHASPSPQTADLMQAIANSHAVLSLGNLAPGSAEDDESARVLATFAALLWISLDRDSVQDEAELLTLCIDVVRSSRDEIEAALASRIDLQAQFDRLAQIV